MISKGVKSIFPIKNQEIWDRYKLHIQAFWTPEEVSLQDDLRDLSFDDEFDINIEDYLPSDDLSQAPLPPTPGVDPTMIQPAVQQASLTQTGLTPSEQALLSPEEQAIRLRQRGMA